MSLLEAAKERMLSQGREVQEKKFAALCRFCGDVICFVEPRGKSGISLGP